ncbi:hypothetical protein ACFYWS_17335 [Streptomyces sp. NPDC002795]|uniref:hypothetical protein n=1 Tax=Streptomyces sp. NPDC002795 TaxID=3364665 RepID=UPI003677B308
MKRVIAAASTALVIFGGVAACGSSTSNDTSGETVSTETQKENPTEPKKEAPAEPDAQREETAPESESQPATEGVPTLKVGETVHVETTEYSDDGDWLSGTADVTLVSVKEYNAADLSDDSVASELEAGQEAAAVTFKIKNTSGTEISTTPYNSSITWTGKDGRVAEVATGFLDDTSTSEDLGGTMSLKPGEYVQGVTVVVIPGTQPGKLHIEDDSGKHLFDVSTQGVA